MTTKLFYDFLPGYSFINDLRTKLTMAPLITGLSVFFVVVAPVNASDQFWQSPLSASSLLIVDEVNERSVSVASNLASSYDTSQSQYTSIEFNQSLSANSAFAIEYSQAEEQNHTMLGYTNRNLSVSFLNGSGEDYSEIGGSYAGVNPFQFHAGLKQKYQYNGFAVDYSVGKFGHVQFGQAKVSAEGLLDRKASYVEWSNNRVFARATQFERGSESIGMGFDGGLAIGANKQVAYQTMQLDNGGSLNRIRLQLNGSHTRQYWIDLTSHRNPLYQDSNDQSIMFSFKTVLGAKKLVSYASEPTVTGTDEEGVEVKKNNTALKRGVFIGAGIAAAAALSSSGSSDRDEMARLRTQDEAAFEVLNRVNPLSVADNKEYGGWIVLNMDGSYSPTDYVVGDNDSVAIPFTLIPAGTALTAIYHTHAAFDPRYDNENFSPQDIESADNLMIDNYVGTPGGQLKHYDYDTGTITTLGSIAN